MINNSEIKSLAASHLDHFDLDFGESGLLIVISSTAPTELIEMIKTVCGGMTQENLVQVYEALNTIVDCEELECCEIDEKVCSTSVYCSLLKYLTK